MNNKTNSILNNNNNDNNQNLSGSSEFETIGLSEQQRPLIITYLGNGSGSSLKIFIMAGQHGDEKYGRKDSFLRLALHAQSLGFVHPKTKQYIEFSSVIPQEFLKRVNGRSYEEIAKLINN